MKYKAPENAGPSVSVGGATFNIVDGVVELPDEGNYAGALEPFGYTAIPPEPVDAEPVDAEPVDAEPVDAEANEATATDTAEEAADAPKPKVKKG